MESGASTTKKQATASAAAATARVIAVAPQNDAAQGADLGGMTAATISAVGDAVQTWNAAKDNSTVQGLIAFVANAVPGFAATLGALGEHAPLVGVVFSVLKVAGAYVSDVAVTKAAYEQFAAAVITTTRLVLQVEEFQRANKVNLPGPVTSALNLYWKQLDTFAALLVQFRGKNYAKRLFGKGAHQAQLNVVRISIEQAARDLDQTEILTSVVQNELILKNQAVAKKQLEAVAKKQDRSLELQEASSGKLDHLNAKVDRILTTSTVASDDRVWLVDPAPAFFVGRAAELARLDALLRPSTDRQAATLVAVSGMGGTGKSTLAQRAAALAAPRFTSGWSLDGSSEATLLADLADKVARSLKLGELKPDEVAGAVQRRLSQATQAGWLLVVDNVDDHAFAPKLAGLLPKTGGCIVVTSRLSDWERSGGGWTMVPVAPLTLAEARQVLVGPGGAVTAADQPQPVLDEVTETLSFLPMAIAQARAYVQRVKIAWAAFLAKLKSQLAALLGQGRKGVLASLQLSLNAAIGEHAAVRTLVQLIQVMHPDAIPRSVVAAAFERLVPSVDVDELLAVLADYSIIVLGEATVSTHRLMQQAMQATVPCEALTAAALGEVMNALVEEKKRLDYPLMRSLLVHYVKVIAALERLSPASTALGAAWHGVGTIHCYSFESDAASKAAFGKALAIQEAALGSDDVVVAKTLRRLGLACGGLGDAEKQKELTERALEINESHYGPDHVEVAETFRNLSNAYSDLGDYAKQKALLERALAIQERHYGPDHAEVAATLSNLGNAYGALGDAAKQKALLERALVIYERHYGPDHVSVAITLASLGNAYGALGNAYGAVGESDKKKALLERALAIKERHYGPDHVSVAITLASLGNAYGALGELSKKKALLERALVIKERHYGPDHVEMAATLGNLGNAYGDLGDAAKMKALLERALALTERHYGPDHVQVAIIVFNLGNAHKALGDMKEARKCMERCLAIQTAYYGGDHPKTKFTVAAIANLL